MSNLACDTISTTIWLSVHDQPAADSRTDGDIQYTPVALSGPVLPFPPRPSVCVVVDHHWYLQSILKSLPKWETLPAWDVVGDQHDPLSKIHGATEADTNCQKFALVLIQELICQS